MDGFNLIHYYSTCCFHINTRFTTQLRVTVYACPLLFFLIGYIFEDKDPVSSSLDLNWKKAKH